MEKSYGSITRHRNLTKYLWNLSNPIVKVKVVLNNKKIKTYSYLNEARLRNVLPDLEEYKIYSLDLYYKEDGYYYPSSLKNLILMREGDKIDIYESKNGKLSDPKCDYLLFGHSKKKIMIQEVDKKIYHIHIRNVSNERNKEQMMDLRETDIEFHRTICIDMNKELDIDKKISKILCNYVYEILHQSVERNAEQSAEKSAERSYTKEMETLNVENYNENKKNWNIDIQVCIIRKKNIWRRIWNELFNK
jgi:hypothetical protein